MATHHGKSSFRDQWNEGDVSCSVVRRVALPDAFFAVDGMLDTFLTVIKQMEVFPAVIGAERERYLPFLLTTTIMMEAVKAGAGREDAHEAIKEHAVGVVNDLRSGKIRENNLISRLAKDKRVGLKKNDLQKILKDGETRIGAAKEQVSSFVERARKWGVKFPEAKDYSPPSIL